MAERFDAGMRFAPSFWPAVTQGVEVKAITVETELAFRQSELERRLRRELEVDPLIPIETQGEHPPSIDCGLQTDDSFFPVNDDVLDRPDGDPVYERRSMINFAMEMESGLNGRTLNALSIPTNGVTALDSFYR